MMKSIATLISVVLCSFFRLGSNHYCSARSMATFCDGECAAKRAFGGHCDRRVLLLKAIRWSLLSCLGRGR